MSDSPQHLKHSVGRPFWIGCLVGPILFLIALAAVGVLKDTDTFWLFGGTAVIVFGPVGGLTVQAGHDLFVAGRSRSLHLWDFLVFIAIAIALVVAGEALFHATGKQAGIDPFRNRIFDIAGAFVAVMLFLYALSRNLAHLLSRQTWLAILLTIALLALCVGISRLTGVALDWALVVGTALWAAMDSAEIHLRRYVSGISYGPVVVFFLVAVLWVIAFPWYLIVRHRIKTGAAILKDHAANAA